MLFPISTEREKNTWSSREWKDSPGWKAETNSHSPSWKSMNFHEINWMSGDLGWFHPIPIQFPSFKMAAGEIMINSSIPHSQHWWLMIFPRYSAEISHQNSQCRIWYAHVQCLMNSSVDCYHQPSTHINPINHHSSRYSGSPLHPITLW